MLPKHWSVGGQATTITEIVDVLLKARAGEDTTNFLTPPHPSTISLKDVGINESAVSNAIERLRRAVEKKEKVVIYGDYDVDGVCATSLLWLTLKKCGVDVLPFIPDRFTDGYGMSVPGIEKIVKATPNTSLIITVDNGIVAHEAIAYAQKKGIDVIVTDHHEESGRNKASVLIHTTQICGTAVAWFFCRSLIAAFFPSDVESVHSFLDLVGIATVSDQMMLVGMNRSLAYHGIYALQHSKRVGLIALAQTCEIDLKNASTYEIGFILGPRMNAAGRMAHALDVVRLLCTPQKERAMDIARSLNTLNTSRQDVLVEVLAQSKAAANQNHNIIIVVGDFHEGVIGLAAGRLVEETGKPSIVLSRGKHAVKGSARSIPGFHITEALRTFENLFINVGGHEMAAGMTLEEERVDELVELLHAYADQHISNELLVKKVKIDLEIPVSVVTIDLYKKIKQFEPFGIGNPRPSFLSVDVPVSGVKSLGKSGEHLKISLGPDGSAVDALLFGSKRFEFVPKMGENIDVVYSIDENTWNGRTKVQLLVKDIHNHGSQRTKKSRERIQKTT